MKLKMIILLSSLLLVQTTVMSVSARSSVMSFMEAQRRRHKAHIENHEEHERYRSILLITGYVEDDVLLLSFSLSLTNIQVRVVDSETGETLFEGIVSGTSLSIPLERDSESFDVYIQ